MKNKKIIGIYCDEDTNNLKLIKDDFVSKESAEEYMKQNNLNDDNYFVESIEI